MTPFSTMLAIAVTGILHGRMSGAISRSNGVISSASKAAELSILGRTISHPDIASQIISRDKFSFLTPNAQQGSIGRNVMRKAKIANWNLALQKSWRIPLHRETTLQLRGEAYNGFNTPQFDEPQRNLSSPSFGKITNTLNDGRVFQLGLRVIL